MRKILCLSVAITLPTPAAAQVDQALAARYFHEADSLCQREAGRLWGISLCGPMVFADPTTKTIATNRPPPDTARPSVLGYANAALKWGDSRWSTYVWQMIPADRHLRARLFMHELFHRVQPDLGLLVNEPNNDHLDTPEGRYWLQLEWRALAKALSDTGLARSQAIEDALGFRAERHQRFPDAAENERRLEINEGLPQYTGTVAATDSPSEARANAIEQLSQVTLNASFVRTFAYPSGTAYGLLLDQFSPGWTRRVKPTDNLALMVMEATHVLPIESPERASLRYGGREIQIAEAQRETERQARVADLRRRFVDGPVVIAPRANGASFITTGVTPIPGIGTVYPTYRVTARWGRLEAALVLISLDQTRIAVPAPATVEGPVLRGEGWTLTLADGWVLKPGDRPGDYQLVQERPDPHE